MAKDEKGKVTAPAAPKKENGPSAVIGELKKVVWPTRKETIYLTIVVLVVAIIVGAFLSVIDLGLDALVAAFLT